MGELWRKRTLKIFRGIPLEYLADFQSSHAYEETTLGQGKSHLRIRGKQGQRSHRRRIVPGPTTKIEKSCNSWGFG